MGNELEFEKQGSGYGRAVMNIINVEVISVLENVARKYATIYLSLQKKG